LPWYRAVFLAGVYTIKACAVENLERNCKNRNIYILSDSQAAIKALGKNHITSGSAINPLYNWPNITEFKLYGCQVMRVLLIMKWQISW
jgi:hypothetical protein